LAEVTNMSGVNGRLEWGYFVAATINWYRVTRRGETWSLRAMIVSRNGYNLAQRPLWFVAPHKFGACRWPVQEWRDDGLAFIATLGPPV
jgi:hypothetical protein